ncbi:MAG: hypothetical protein AMJ43_01415 [Coxiella sp. DG_40]|nr:MAG: hypothetical protein AMJ43_01415 [Coxiella sp. DG_40]
MLKKGGNAKQKNKLGLIDSYIEEVNADMTHDLQMSFVIAQSGISGVKDYLPQLIKIYQEAEKHNLNTPKIYPQHLKSLAKALEEVKKEVCFINYYIDILLMDLCESITKDIPIEICSIKECINQAFQQYPYRSDEQSLIMHYSLDFSDFTFKGNKRLMKYVFFCLIRNAIKQIKQTDGGNIKFSSRKEGNYSYLTLKYTGLIKCQKKFKRIFSKFCPFSTYNIGLGSHFCHRIMRNIGGDITCKFKKNKYILFDLCFPHII